MYEHKISLHSKHKYYPIVQCSLTANAKGAVKDFLHKFYDYKPAPAPQILTVNGFIDGRGESVLYTNDMGLKYPYCGSLPNEHLKSLQYGVSKEDSCFNVIYKYDQYMDLPWTYSYKVFDEIFPNAKFILTERDPEDWYLNVLGTWRQLIDNDRWCNPVLNDYWSLEKIPPLLAI